MADVTKSNATFRSFIDGALALEETKRGLGKVFHQAVMELLNENPGKTPEELSALYVETLKELANVYTEKLEGKSLAEALPSFKQYLSDYKRGIELLGYDIRKCGGVLDVKNKKAEKLAELNGNTDPDNGGGKGAGNDGGASKPSEYDGLSEAVRKRLDNAIKGLAKLSEAEAEEIVTAFEGRAWATVKKGNKKMGVVGARAA